MKTQHGFSTIELAVVLALAGVAVAMAAPSMTGLIKGSRMTAATNQFVTALRFARAQALDKGNVSIIATTAGAWEDGWVIIDANNAVLRTFPAIRGDVTLTGTVDTITYSTTGNLTTAPDTINVCDDTRVGETGRTISIQAVGRVSVNSTFVCP